jgi:hypothetical protein
VDESSLENIKVSKSLKISLTGAAIVFEDDLLVTFLSDLSKLIENPITITL